MEGLGWMSLQNRKETGDRLPKSVYVTFSMGLKLLFVKRGPQKPCV